MASAPAACHRSSGLGHLAPERLHDGLPEGVRVVELHHPAPCPRGVVGRPRVAVDGRHLMAPPRECASEEQARRSGSDDHDLHVVSSPWSNIHYTEDAANTSTHVNAFSGGPVSPATDIPLDGPSGVRPADPASHRRGRARALRDPGVRRHHDRRGRRGRRGQPPHRLPLGRLEGRAAEDRLGLGRSGRRRAGPDGRPAPRRSRCRRSPTPSSSSRLWVDQVLAVADRLAPLEVVLNRAVDADAEAAPPCAPGSTSSGGAGR